jgi:hypothetical protein
VLDAEHDVAEAVEGQRVADDVRALDARPRKLQGDEVRRVHRLPGLGRRRALGQARGDWRERVAPVERRGHRLQAVRRVAHVDRLHRAAEACRGERQQPVVRADQEPVLLGGAQRDRAALAADARIDHRQMDARREVGQRPAEDQRAGAHVVALDAVRHVEHADLRRQARDDAVAHADELVVVAVVGQERYDSGHGGGR